jgi:predicted N-acyltransferase
VIAHCKTSTNGIDTSIFSSINQIEIDDWNEVNQDKNIYLSIPYLRAIEDGLQSFDFRYIIFYDNLKQPVGIGYCQIVKISKNEINTEALSKRMGGMLPKHLINSLDLRVLICGNAFASGENGFAFTNKIDPQEGFDLLSTTIDEINFSEKKKHRKIAISLIKEFWPETFVASSCLKEAGCFEVNIDVNMILHLDPSWKSFEDYIAAMNSKFRTKANHVRTISKQLNVVDFSVDEIENRMEEIDQLYNAIVNKANFSFGRLNAQTLLNIKKALGDQFFFRGYYLDNDFVAFGTATSFDDVLDGNFIGLDYDYNQDYGMYQRILYDFVEHAFKIGAKEIRIGRTAEEIKSGIGATPTHMKFYAKHRNKVTNAILRPFVQNLKPSEFNLRRPFKATYYS